MQQPELRSLAWLEAKADEATGVFTGLGAAYNVDAYGDKILPGAFEKTIAEKDGRVPLFLNHSMDCYAGTTVALSENKRGLAVEGKLFLDTSHGRDAYGLLKNAAAAGARIGLSIGFIAVDYGYEGDTRVIKTIDLWEVSFTPFPAQPRAYVQDVKTLREIERELRDANLTRIGAKRLIALIASAKQSMPSGTLGDADRHARLLAAISEGNR